MKDAIDIGVEFVEFVYDGRGTDVPEDTVIQNQIIVRAKCCPVFRIFVGDVLVGERLY